MYHVACACTVHFQAWFIAELLARIKEGEKKKNNVRDQIGKRG